MLRQYELNYVGKQPENDVLESTEACPIQLVKIFGSPQLFVNQEEWVNMLILGENLSVLKSLLDDTRVKGNVRLVYIDPPFSTDQDFKSGDERVSTISPSADDRIAYQDTLVGSQYIEFLRRRLIFLREILADDGSIYVHIDSRKGHYVKVIMDEIFGEDYFINDITRMKCNPKNFARRAYGNIKDMILFYSKTCKYVWHDSKEDMTHNDIVRLFPKIDAEGNRYTTIPLHGPGETRNGPTGQAWKDLKPPKGRHWRTNPDELTRLDEEGLIEWSPSGNPRKKVYADITAKIGKKRQNIWEFKDPQYPIYPTQKNAEMIQVIIEASSNPGDIVLDCFSGSGTTLACAERMSRKWIGIDNSELAINTAIKRLISMKPLTAFGLYDALQLALLQSLEEIHQ